MSMPNVNPETMGRLGDGRVRPTGAGRRMSRGAAARASRGRSIRK